MTQTPQRTAPLAPEHLLLRFGLLSLDQLNVALREQSATGTPFTEVLLRDGIVSAADLARALGEPVLPAPLPVEVEPEAEVEVAPEPEPLPAPVVTPPPAAAPAFLVRGRLSNGEDVEIATVSDGGEAQRIALDAMRACARTAGSDWPILNGRYVRPDSILTIEVVEVA